jgi:hypothetical protein
MTRRHPISELRSQRAPREELVRQFLRRHLVSSAPIRSQSLAAVADAKLRVR